MSALGVGISGTGTLQKGSDSSCQHSLGVFSQMRNGCKNFCQEFIKNENGKCLAEKKIILIFSLTVSSSCVSQLSVILVLKRNLGVLFFSSIRNFTFV